LLDTVLGGGVGSAQFFESLLCQSYEGLIRELFFREEQRLKKHVFLRNEPELKTVNCERILQATNELGRAIEFLHSGSFGEFPLFLVGL
jgi:hypothetical protein